MVETCLVLISVVFPNQKSLGRAQKLSLWRKILVANKHEENALFLKISFGRPFLYESPRVGHHNQA